MTDLNRKVVELGKTLTEEFELINRGKLTAVFHIFKLKKLATKAEGLQKEVAEGLGVSVTKPLETLQNIIMAADAQHMSGTEELKTAVELLAKIKPQLPENACPTPEGLQQIVQKEMKPKQPPTL
jgi:hypothetical protein